MFDFFSNHTSAHCSKVVAQTNLPNQGITYILSGAERTLLSRGLCLKINSDRTHITHNSRGRELK